MADESYRHSPFVLEEQDASKLRQPVRAVLKRTRDRFPVGDRQRHDVAFVVAGVLEDRGSVLKPFRAEAPRKLKY